MEPIKLTNNLEFDLVYGDGTRTRVKEGILFEAQGEKMFMHLGSNRKEVLFTIIKCVLEAVGEMDLSFELMEYLESDD
jgi:hypothetical protein